MRGCKKNTGVVNHFLEEGEEFKECGSGERAGGGGAGSFLCWAVVVVRTLEASIQGCVMQVEALGEVAFTVIVYCKVCLLAVWRACNACCG